MRYVSEIKKILPIIIISFLLLIPLSIAGITGFSEMNVQADNVFDGEGDVWVGEWNAIGTDKISGTLTSDEIEQGTEEYKTQQSFTMDMKSTDSYATYNFGSGEGLRDYVAVEIIEKEISWATNDQAISQFNQWAENNCIDLNNDGNEDYAYKFGWTTDRAVCYRKWYQVATTHRINTPVENWKTKWSLEVGNKGKKTFTLTNDDSISSGTTKNLDNQVLIKYQGTLDWGVNPPDASNEIGLQSNEFYNGWRIGSRNNYRNYVNTLENADSCLADILAGSASKTYCSEKINEKWKQGVEWTGNDEFEKYIDVEILGDDSFKIDMQEKMNVPSFQVFIDADYLDLYIPTGTPSITSVSGVKVKEGSVSEVPVGVKNIGDGEGSFDLWITDCTDYVRGTSTVDQFTLNSGESTTRRLNIVGSSVDEQQLELDASCSVKMKERTTGQIDTYDFDVTLEQQTECEIGRQKRFQRSDGIWVIQECKDGLKYVTIEECEPDQIATLQNDGTYSCEQKEPKCGNGVCEEGENVLNCEQDCGSTTNCGDGVCDEDENAKNCPGDCDPECGNGICEPGEKDTCEQDCQGPQCDKNFNCGALDIGCKIDETLAGIWCQIVYLWQSVAGYVLGFFSLLSIGLLTLMGSSRLQGAEPLVQWGGPLALGIILGLIVFFVPLIGLPILFILIFIEYLV